MARRCAPTETNGIFPDLSSLLRCGRETFRMSAARCVVNIALVGTSVTVCPDATPPEDRHEVGDRGRQANGLAVFAMNGEDAVPGAQDSAGYPRTGKPRASATAPWRASRVANDRFAGRGVA